MNFGKRNQILAAHKNVVSESKTRTTPGARKKEHTANKHHGAVNKHAPLARRQLHAACGSRSPGVSLAASPPQPPRWRCWPQVEPLRMAPRISRKPRSVWAPWTHTLCRCGRPLCRSRALCAAEGFPWRRQLDMPCTWAVFLPYSALPRMKQGDKTKDGETHAERNHHTNEERPAGKAWRHQRSPPPATAASFNRVKCAPSGRRVSSPGGDSRRTSGQYSRTTDH
jgi:hypothetical protein